MLMSPRHKKCQDSYTYAYVIFDFQPVDPQAPTTPSRNCCTPLVHSRTHFASKPIAKEPLVPFLLKARISLAPTHFASHTARLTGINLLRHWSRSALPRIPWGIVRLSLRKGTDGLARSRSQASRLLSVRVTRGGGLKVDGALTVL